MSTVNAFTPKGQSYLVTTASVQIKTQDNVSAVSYRFVNLTSSTVTINWLPADPLGAAVTVAAPTVPTAGSPSTSLTFLAGSIEVVSLPPNVWLRSDTATSLMVTPGEGI